MVGGTTRDVAVPTTPPHALPGTVLALVLAACSVPATISPSATAARSFRPISGLFFLSDRPAVTVLDDTGLVPDSKIEWDLRVTAQNLGLTRVEIHVREANAQLSGDVPTAELREQLLEVTRSTRGVKSVTATLEIRP